MTQTLYSLRTHIDADSHSGYFITKFVDGEVESAYVCTPTECECPAGSRPSCRHRQMLPRMLAAGIVNTHWFWDFDLDRVVDFEGQLKSNLDALNELAEGQRSKGDALREYAAESGKPIADLSASHSAQSGHEIGRLSASPAKSWRRL